jgi:hypothetical protein
MIADKDRLRTDRGELERALKDAGAVFKGKACMCPFHEDKHPSGSIHRGDDSVWRFKCHVPTCGFHGDVFDVRARLSGRSVEDLLREHGDRDAKRQPPRKPERVFPTIEAIADSVRAWSVVEDVYAYTDPVTGSADLAVVRHVPPDSDRKLMIQFKPVPGGFAKGAPPKPWPLFNRTRMAAAEVVIACEGEKCVKAFQAAGHVATTSPGGAGNARHANWMPLSGKRAVYLWRDNDEDGKKYEADVTAMSQGLPNPPALFRIPVEQFDLPEGGDVVEYLEAFGGDTPESKHNAIKCAMEMAVPFGPSSSVRDLLERTIDGRRAMVELPWHCMSRLTNATLPGTVTTVCGEGGASKSFSQSQLGIHCMELGVKFAIYQLESDEEGSHLLRALVQKTGTPELLDPRWVKAHPEEARALFQEHRQFLDAFGGRLTTPPAQPPTYNELLRWIRAKAEEGCRVIIIDPITAAEGSEQPWEDDKRFVLAAQVIMREKGASLVLVTHPRKGAKGTGGDDIAGGAAFFRFSQTVLWVRKHDPAKLVRCKSAGGERLVEINRSVKIAKARLGKGGGLELGYIFDRSMQFAEQGVIVKSGEKQEEEEGEPATEPPMRKQKAVELANRLCQLFPGQMNKGHKAEAIRVFRKCPAPVVEKVIGDWFAAKKPFDLPGILQACEGKGAPCPSA